jgi:hypothetical protein
LKKYFLCAIFFTIVNYGQAQINFYALDTIQKIEIFFSVANYDFMMDTAKNGAESYILADSAIVNGIHFDSVGVRYKGNSSYDSTAAKNPYHIELNHFIAGQSYNGIEDIKLSNGYKDPSMIREVLAYHILNEYMHAPRANFAQLYINGNLIGLYTNVESIGNGFAKRNGMGDGNTQIKCNPISSPGVTTKSNFRKLSPHDSTSYLPLYELKNGPTWQPFYDLIDTINSSSADIKKAFDIDKVIWMLAFNNLNINLDSYSGVFAQNHYVLQDNNDRFNPVVWDLNMCFGGFPFLGSQNSSLNTQIISQLKNMSLFIHQNDTYWPLMNKVYSDTTYKRQYIAHLKTMLDSQMSNGKYLTVANQLRSIIDTAVQSDPNKFYTHAQFLSALNTDINVGNYTVPGIQNLMNDRVTFLNSQASIQAVSPVITTSTFTPQTPIWDQSVTIKVNIANANKAYIGIRFKDDGIFSRIPLYDDGLHNDNMANDGIYATAFLPQGREIQYYFYAENSTQGAFLPVQAELSYYKQVVSIPLATNLDVRINEVMSNNVNVAVDEYGQYNDWIELYTTKSKVSLANMYLSDDWANWKKWKFPADASISNTDNYKIIWADNSPFQKGWHSNFQLNDSGSVLILSRDDGALVDSMSWSTVMPANLSWIRCGTSAGFATNFAVFPSFKAHNCPVGVSEIDPSLQVKIYPNPVNDIVFIESKERINELLLSDISGRPIFTDTPLNHKSSIDLSTYPSGVYLIRINDRMTFKLIK